MYTLLDKFLAPNTHEAEAYNHLKCVSFFASSLLLADVAYSCTVRSGRLGTPINRLLTNPLFLVALLIAHLTATSEEKTSFFYQGRVPNWKVFCKSLSVVFFKFLTIYAANCRRRYAYDAIHNAIAISRSPLQTGGYSRVKLLYGIGYLFLIFGSRSATWLKNRFEMC